MPSVNIEKAIDTSYINQVKTIADKHRVELGFHNRRSIENSLRKGELLVALVDGRIFGFIRYHHRRDKRTTLYEIVTIPEVRGKGIGRRLINALIEDCQKVGSRCIRLSCPVELPANRFYEAIGFTRSKRQSNPGKNRPLYEWELPVLPQRSITFVASLTASGHDLQQMIRIWETEGPYLKPFEKCIITPLFIESKAFESVRYMHERWGVDVIFDSGGFFVQQGKISYDELFKKLLDFYCQHEWAETYVMPDFVPTSRQSFNEVTERVHVTAAEGVRFLKRLPQHLRNRALGVLQGHTPEHLKFCFEEFMNNGFNRIGFGSFDTGGVNSEINLLTERAAVRLCFVRDIIRQAFINSIIKIVPELHLFGVSSPNVLSRFRDYLATSYDSSGWLRTAGYGNVYLPFQGRRNISHGSSAQMNGGGMNASEFYTQCERTQHSCPFCKDFSRLQKDRFARMWHNAIVFNEMTNALNRNSINN